MKKKSTTIVYVDMSESTFPVLCDKIEQDKIREDFVNLVNVKGMKDNVYPFVEIESLSLPRENIKYYVEGYIEIKEKEVQQTDDAEPLNTGDVNTKKDKEWEW